MKNNSVVCAGDKKKKSHYLDMILNTNAASKIVKHENTKSRGL